MGANRSNEELLGKEVVQKTQLHLIYNALKKDKFAMTSLVFMILVIVMSVFAPWIAPYGYNEADPSLRLSPPLTPGHVLGILDVTNTYAASCRTQESCVNGIILYEQQHKKTY